MRLWVQCLVLLAVVVIIADQNGVEAKKNKQKHGRSQERSPAESGHSKEKSRKVRDVSKESGTKEKYNKKEEVKPAKQTKKNKNEYKDKKTNEFVDKKSSKQDKKQEKTAEYVDKKQGDKKGKKKDEKVKVEEVVMKNVEEEPMEEGIADENAVEVMTNEGVEVTADECGAKATEDKLVQCNKKTDSVETNMTETCQKYKSEKNMKVIEQTVIGDKIPATASSSCDACRS